MRGRHKKTVEMLNAAMAHIQSVPHAVGLRWVFYRLLQDDILKNKSDYNKLKAAASTARKEFWNDWHPSTLIDEGRRIVRSEDPKTRQEVIDELPWQAELTPNLFEDQECVPFIVFEAATMDGQFKHFAPWCDRAAFRGDASIPHKWNIARRCDALESKYGKQVHILYFGDYDYKGLQIPESAMDDIHAWTDGYVEFTRCGINQGHAERFSLPERGLKAGVYEWESLSSDDAGTLISESLSEVVNLDEIQDAIDAADEVTSEFQDEIREALSALEEDE